jgi:cyclopropane fatty-acyl-phospholipid synthase-like methyltransferase
MRKDWYRDWFASEDYLDVYHHRDTEDSEKIVSLILSHIDLKHGSEILDAACGAGRHAINFAQKGFIVMGFDLSETMLQIANEDSVKKNLDIVFENADLRAFETNKKFDLVVSLFTSFGYFYSDVENFTFIENAYHMLKDTGYYVLDYFNKTHVEKNLIQLNKRMVGNKEIIESRKISDRRVIKTIKIRKDKHVNEFIESVRLYSFEELTDGFKKTGYKLFKVFGDYDGNDYNKEKSERCIIIFQK